MTSDFLRGSIEVIYIHERELHFTITDDYNRNYNHSLNFKLNQEQNTQENCPELELTIHSNSLCFALSNF